VPACRLQGGLNSVLPLAIKSLFEAQGSKPFPEIKVTFFRNFEES
jgi:hypothetical protein